MKKLLIGVAIAVVLVFLGCPSENVSYITVTPDPANIGSTETQQFTATAYDADSVEVDVDFTWTSSNTAVATVDENGLATAVATGTCTITAASGDVEGTADLTVTSGPTYHSGTISADETWYASANPHIIQGDVDVSGNATLTIEAGCIVRFEPGYELYAGYNGAGAIIANGTATDSILFTSNVAAPAAGDWMNVGLYEYAMNTSSFSYCIFEYAGSSSGYPGALYGDGMSFMDITNCTISNSGNYGVYLTDDAGFSSFSNNTITTCAQYPLRINAEYARTIGTGNAMTGNTIGAVLVSGGTVHTSGTWINPGIAYVIDSNVEIADDNTDPVITIASGNTIRFQPDVELYTGYSGSGGLIADGTSGRITFTSNVSSPSSGDWINIGFYDYSIDASCQLINCNLVYGGGSAGFPGIIYIDDAIPEITGDSIGHSGNYGISLYGTAHPDSLTLLNDNTFYDCPSGNVYQP
ncbi:MAG TPA: Ig-like domain-containing protein [bacterium]